MRIVFDYDDGGKPTVDVQKLPFDGAFLPIIMKLLEALLARLLAPKQ